MKKITKKEYIYIYRDKIDKTNIIKSNCAKIIYTAAGMSKSKFYRIFAITDIYCEPMGKFEIEKTKWK